MEKKEDKDRHRIIGKYTCNKEGPLLFVTGGIHGNEPSGIRALERVFRELESTKPQIKGTIIGVLGNKLSLNQNKRFIDEDLNRTWTEENIAQGKRDTCEQREMFEIIKILKEHPEEDFTKRFFLDCHTTSSPSLPFISVQMVNDNDAWAHQFPTYIIRGFSDIVYGCIDHYLSRTGLTGFVFEGGQHVHETSEENHEGMIWLALEKACDLDLSKISCYPECVDNFAKKNAPPQKTFEIVYRHGLEEVQEFQMEPGYENFQKISKGELLAIQDGNEVRSKWDAHIFMPLYQAQGKDGFFIIEEVEV